MASENTAYIIRGKESPMEVLFQLNVGIYVTDPVLGTAQRSSLYQLQAYIYSAVSNLYNNLNYSIAASVTLTYLNP